MTYPIDHMQTNSRWLNRLTVNNKNPTRKLKRSYVHSTVKILKTLKIQKLVSREVL